MHHVLHFPSFVLSPRPLLALPPAYTAERRATHRVVPEVVR
jgi:hypothetical protein